VKETPVWMPCVGAAVVIGLAVFVCSGGLAFLGPHRVDRSTEAILCAELAVRTELAPTKVTFVPFGQVAQRRSDGTYAVSGSIWQKHAGKRVRSQYAVIARIDPGTERMVCVRCLAGPRIR
jgi:hypothetical protein